MGVILERFSFGLLAFALFANGLSAQEDLSSVSSFISETASAVCDEFQKEGGTSTVGVDAAVEAEINALFKRLGSADLVGAVQFDSETYAGVLRGELGAQLTDIRACRLVVWKDLKPAADKPQ